MLKTQSNLPPPPLAIDVAPAGESCHLADSGSGRWRRSPHNGCSRLSLAHATPFGQAASSSGSRHMHLGHAASSQDLEMVPERASRAGSCVAVVVVLQLLAIMSLSLAGISRGCHRRRSPSPSFKRHGLNLDPRLADCRQTTKDPFAIFAELEMDGAWSFHSMASRKATQSPFAVPAMRQSVSAPKPGSKSRLNVMRIRRMPAADVNLMKF